MQSSAELVTSPWFTRRAQEVLLKSQSKLSPLEACALLSMGTQPWLLAWLTFMEMQGSLKKR